MTSFQEGSCTIVSLTCWLLGAHRMLYCQWEAQVLPIIASMMQCFYHLSMYYIVSWYHGLVLRLRCPCKNQSSLPYWIRTCTQGSLRFSTFTSQCSSSILVVLLSYLIIYLFPKDNELDILFFFYKLFYLFITSAFLLDIFYCLHIFLSCPMPPFNI